MKKLILTALIALLLCPFLLADSVTGLGLSGIYDEPYSRGEFGLYTNYYYTFPIDSSPVSLGFGSRLDFSFSIPLDTLSLGFMSGFALDVELGKQSALYLMFGPQVTMISPDTDPGILGIGGALDVGITYYFNEARTTGGTLGIVNYFSAILPDEDSAYFGYYGGVYLGITIRFPTPFYGTLPPGYSYIDYISV